eukprot:m.227645 g.227645  ORF g.227645 m.227645 type:complete len:173 (+) comp17273_c0_seq1:1175-1693(+)
MDIYRCRSMPNLFKEGDGGPTHLLHSRNSSAKPQDVLKSRTARVPDVSPPLPRHPRLGGQEGALAGQHSASGDSLSSVEPAMQNVIARDVQGKLALCHGSTPTAPCERVVRPTDDHSPGRTSQDTSPQSHSATPRRSRAHTHVPLFNTSTVIDPRAAAAHTPAPAPASAPPF